MKLYSTGGKPTKEQEKVYEKLVEELYKILKNKKPVTQQRVINQLHFRLAKNWKAK